ncbi:MAG: hypothetical protein ABSE05_14955 [Syntrophales bacterium]|jgi:glutaconate CoA-transferase subunit B
MIYEKRQFVEECDYVTTPSYLKGGNSRCEEGLPEETGPAAVISTRGVLRFSPETKEMYLETHHPGVTVNSHKGECELVSEGITDCAGDRTADRRTTKNY